MGDGGQPAQLPHQLGSHLQQLGLSHNLANLNLLMMHYSPQPLLTGLSNPVLTGTLGLHDTWAGRVWA